MTRSPAAPASRPVPDGPATTAPASPAPPRRRVLIAWILDVTRPVLRPLAASAACRVADLLAGVGLFSLGALAAGLANSLSELILWRTLQGMGGGLLIPLGQALTWPLFQPHERAKLSAAVMLVGLLAPACSPAIGGLLVEAFSWRWVFFASLPVALLTFVLAVRWLNDSPGPVRPTRFLPLSLLADPLLRFAMLIYLCVPGMFIGVNVVGMFYLQRVTGMAPGAIGALMVPWSLASFAAITFTGRYFNRFGPRPLVVIGCLLQAAGILLLVWVLMIVFAL